MHKFKWQQRTKRFILVLVSLLTLLSIVITGVRSYAVPPDTAFAYIVKFQGNGLTLGTGDIRNRQPVSLKDKLADKKILYVPGGNKPWVHLAFAVDYPKDFAGLIVKAGPHPDVSEWSFPCTAKGGLTIAWKRGSDRGCEKGIGVQRSGSRSGWLPAPNYTLQASRKLLKAQTDDEVTVVPGQGETVIQTSDNATGIIVDVLVGEVRVKSAKNSEGRLVRAGERYSYPQDTITAIDPNSILNSPTVQDFLNPNNWRSPDIPQRVADGIAGQLEEMRTALGKGSPAVASNSGNNNNSNQSPLNQPPQRTATLSTQPQPSQPGVNLNGEWTFNFGYFIAKSDGSCEAAPEAGSYQGKITITQNSSQLNISAPGAVPMTNGTVSDNQFESSGPSPMRWVGTISSDGNKISGSGICGSVNMPFTMTRQGSQASSPTSSPGGSPPVITKFTCNGNNSSCTAAWKASNSLSISYTDDDGDASSWIVSGYTEGKSSSEGQILPANGRSSSIDTSVSCTCEGRGCSSTRTFPMRVVVIDATGLQGTASLNLQCQPSVIDRLQDIIRDRVPIPRLPF
ncbi:hypothetical protein QUB00_26735 [Microcoleus sp. F8_C2]